MYDQDIILLLLLRARKYTAFITEDSKNEYEFLRVAFGICVAPSYFVLMINTALEAQSSTLPTLIILSFSQNQKANIWTTLDKYSTALEKPLLTCI